MLRHPRKAARLLVLAAFALACAGCGTKGPLTPPPKDDAASGEAIKPGTADKRPAPKL